MRSIRGRIWQKGVATEVNEIKMGGGVYSNRPLSKPLYISRDLHALPRKLSIGFYVQSSRCWSECCSTGDDVSRGSSAGRHAGVGGVGQGTHHSLLEDTVLPLQLIDGIAERVDIDGLPTGLLLLAGEHYSAAMVRLLKSLVQDKVKCLEY